MLRKHLESETDTHVSSVQIYTFRQTGVGEVNQLLLLWSVVIDALPLGLVIYGVLEEWWAVQLWSIVYF